MAVLTCRRPGALNKARPILAAAAYLLLAIPFGPVLADDARNSAATRIGAVVENALSAQQRQCAAAADEPRCAQFFDHLQWTPVPGESAVVFTYRAPGAPFAGTIKAGSPEASRWDAVVGPLHSICETVAGAIHHAGWSGVSVFMVGLQKATPDFFGPTTNDGYRAFLALGPKYGGGCGAI